MEPAWAVPVLPATDLQRAKRFYAETLELPVTDGVAGITVGEGRHRLFVIPARESAPGSFTQAALQVPDVRAEVSALRSRGIRFEDYDLPELKTEDGVARMPDGDDAAWFKDSEGNLLVIVPTH
jgi:catechol 2,3-dioxygenase-like lactoylglutathione lyase family enzyme